jgi:hypothetical protein
MPFYPVGSSVLKFRGKKLFDNLYEA